MADPLAAYDAANFHADAGRTSFAVVRNRDRLPGPDTGTGGVVAILGTGRSGTTMTAGVAMMLGLEFGDRLNPRLGDEDLTEPFRAMRRSPLWWRALALRGAVREVVRARVARWGRWGFKSPDLTAFYPLLAPLLPNAVLVMPVRDVLATSFGYTEHVEGGWAKSFATLGLFHVLLTQIAVRTKRPILVFGYEGAKARPEEFVDLLAAFLRLAPTAAARADALRYISPEPGYRPVTRMFGYVEEFDPGWVRGWVTDVTDRTRPVPLRLEVDGRIVAEARADVPRDDVAAAGHHPTGACGYAFAVEPPLPAEDLARARLVAAGTGHVIHRGGDETHG